MNKILLSLLVLFISTTISTNLYASELQELDYAPDDEACIRHVNQKCGDIDLSKYSDCTFDYVNNNIVFDNKGRVITIKESKTTKIKGDYYLIETTESIGCDHHGSTNLYYIKFPQEITKVTCHEVLSLLTATKREAYDTEEECKLYNPDANALETHCSITPAWEPKEEERYGGCGQALTYAFGGFFTTHSDKEEYDLKIEETGYYN